MHTVSGYGIIPATSIQVIDKDGRSISCKALSGPEVIKGKDQAADGAAVIYKLYYNTVEETTGIITINKNESNNEIVFKDIKLKTMSKEEVILAGIFF